MILTDKWKPTWILTRLCLLVDPVKLSRLPRLDLFLGKPESDLLLRTLDTIGAVADVPTNIDSVVTTNGAGSRGKGVGGTEDG